MCFYSTKKIFLFLASLHLLFLLSFFSSAQKIENVHAEQEGKKINIYYNITGTKTGQTFDIKVYCSKDGGYTWGSPLYYVTGDVGKGIKGGYNKKIIWDVLKDIEKLEGDKIQFEIRAAVKGGAIPGMVLVQGGTFQMGSKKGDNDEKPVHTVTVSDFHISKYEVTHRQFIKFLNDKGVQKNGSFGGKEYIDMDDGDCAIGYSNGFYFKGSKHADNKNCPVIEVTWFGARAFCEWAGGRLPTEAEWEFAARGGNKSRGYKYSGSNNAGTVAWYDDNSGSKTHPVGTKQSNELGIYDMSGNVWEWCSDWYDVKYYKKSPTNNPKGPSSGKSRVLRGGSWSSSSYYTRSAVRLRSYPDYSYLYNGFRFVLDL